MLKTDLKKFVCIHGHFYQPPRENAWLGVIEYQESAAPSPTNDRVCVPISVSLSLVIPAYFVMERRAVSVDLASLVRSRFSSPYHIF